MSGKRKALPIIILILIAALLTGSYFLYRYLTRTIFNEPDVYGNTGGNYYNKGLFCERDGFVYFSNPYDGYRLYRMTPEGREAEQISSDYASFINADGNYVYYVRNNGSYDTDLAFLHINTNSLCRVSKNGGTAKLLDKAPSLYSALVGNYVYYIHYDDKTASTLYKVKIDGTDKKMLNKSPLLLSPAPNGSLCYSGLEGDHNIRLFNSANDSSSVLSQCVSFNPVDTGSYVYYMDGEKDYVVMRLEKSSGQTMQMTDCRVDCFNLSKNYLYYQKNQGDNYAFCRVPLNGSGGEEVVENGIFCDINITSEYVYFRDFNDKDIFYQSPADGGVNVTSFSFQESE